MQNSQCRVLNIVGLLCVLHFAFCIGACSVPKLETAECSQARDAVKRFYSFHLGNDMQPSYENLAARRAFISPELASKLAATSDMSRDYFTDSDNFPRAFRVGECNSESVGRPRLSVLLLWRDDTSTDQKTITVSTVRAGNKWLIDEVSNQ